MTIATVCRSVARRVQVTVPLSFVGSTDATAALLLEILDEAADDLVRRHPWQRLRKEHTFTTVAASAQTDGIPADFSWIVPDTAWNRTQQRPLHGPAHPVDWQRWESTVTGVIHDRFILRGGVFLVLPAPPADETFSYEYVTTKVWQDSNEVAAATYSADTDSFLLPEPLLILAMKWRYKRDKGLDYAEDFQEAEKILLQHEATEAGAGTVDMAGMRRHDTQLAAPFIPEGGWSP